MTPEAAAELEVLELDLFIEAMLRRYGYDFRDYGRASLVRRVRNLVQKQGASSIADLTAKILHAPELLGDMIANLTLQMNRARQAQITKELIEIISGAEAL